MTVNLKYFSRYRFMYIFIAPQKRKIQPELATQQMQLVFTQPFALEQTVITLIRPKT